MTTVRVHKEPFLFWRNACAFTRSICASSFPLARCRCFARTAWVEISVSFEVLVSFAHDMDFRRRRLASVLGPEGRDALFNLTAPLRIFFAQLVRDPVDLKTFELAPLIGAKRRRPSRRKWLMFR